METSSTASLRTSSSCCLITSYVYAMGVIEQRMGLPNLSPEEKQSLTSMLQNVTEEYSALRAIYPNVAIPAPSEQQPPMGYPNAQGSMSVYAMPPAASTEASSEVPSDSQATFPELPKLEDEAIAQEVPTTERNIVDDIKRSWETGVNNVREYMKDPHVGVVVMA